MKILWVVRPAQGGIVQHLQQLSKGIDDFEIVVAAPSGLAHQLEKRRFIPLDLADGLKFGQDLNAIINLRKIIKTERVQIVHAHGLKAAMITAAAKAASDRARFMFTVHNSLAESPFLLGRWGTNLLKRWLFRGMDTIISVSEALRLEILKFAPERKVFTVYNGVSPARFGSVSSSDSRALSNLSGSDLVVGTVARLIPAKGVSTLLEAVSLIQRILPRLRLVIVGEGPERDRLQKYAQGLGLGRLAHFMGWRDDVPELMAGWDCFALPSLSEGFNFSVLEAMASRLPVVVSDLPPFREAVVAGRGGFFAAPGNAPDLAAALLHVLKSPEKARAMGEFNRERINTTFAEEKMIRSIRALYEGSGS